MPEHAELSELSQALSHYLAPADLALVESAYRFSDNAHAGQTRVSGEPYITHPVAVAAILSEWRMDAAALSAALLHDVMEDTGTSKSTLEQNFGGAVAELVDGVSKLERVGLANALTSKEDEQADTLRKMFLAMSRDVRVMLIKLADRLHNMRTLGVLSAERRRRIAQETLDIYAPIAERLGLAQVASELRDTSFRYLFPSRHRVIAKEVRAAHGRQRDWISQIQTELQLAFVKQGLNAEITHREKSAYSIYRKMREKHVRLNGVTDVFGFRVLVPSPRDCYVALGILHGLYKPLWDKFKDYIALPKENGYQSLHTALVGPHGSPFEVQIRTPEMHSHAEVGVASHWLYKAGGEEDRNAAQLDARRTLKSLLEIESVVGDSREFLEHVRHDLYPEDIYVLTPKGKFVALPRGATALDFAYAVHTEVGNRCVSAVVNQEPVPFYTVLHNGDQVRIETSPEAHPTPGWPQFVQTARARSKIRHYLRGMQQHESSTLGERLLKQAVATLGGDWEAISKERWRETAILHGASGKPSLLSDVGTGLHLAFTVAAHLLGREWNAPGPESPVPALLLTGAESGMIRFGKCCQPLPGDDISGLFRKSVGLEVHRETCQQSRKQLLDAVEWVPVSWASDVKGQFATTLKLTVRNQKGVLGQLATLLSEENCNIENISMENLEDGLAVLAFTIHVRRKSHLAQVLRQVRRVEAVYKAERG